MDPTFEADPIGRRLECLPKKGININFNIIFKGVLNGAPGAPKGLIKLSPGAPGDKKNWARNFWKLRFFGPEVSTIFEISIFRFLGSKLIWRRIRRRLECRPKIGIDILIDITFPLGPPGVIKFPLGPMG